MTMDPKNTPAADAAIPFMDVANQAFWAAARAGELTLRRCTACARPHWYPRPQCPYCLGDTRWERASGRGTIYALSVDRTGAAPLAVAYVRLEEGVTVLTNVVDCDVERLAIGQAVVVRFQPGADGVPLPMFTPAGA